MAIKNRLTSRFLIAMSGLVLRGRRSRRGLRARAGFKDLAKEETRQQEKAYQNQSKWNEQDDDDDHSVDKKLKCGDQRLGCIPSDADRLPAANTEGFDRLLRLKPDIDRGQRG